MGESTQATGGNRTTEVIRAATVQDVTEAVIQAAAEAVPLVVVGGGHSVWARTDVGGLRLELADLADVQVDGTIVRVGGGATWGQVAAELADHGLAISSGDTSTVGVGGLTTGGGIGWMVRMWGLAADQLIGAQVVTATGEVIETSALHEPELFWALRGGGGNFGVVTRFDFQAHPLPGIAFAEGVIDGDAAEVLRTTRDLMKGAPRELTVTYMDVPPMDPSAPAGARLSAVWAGPEPERLRAALAPVAELDGVTVEITTPAYRDILMEMPAPDAESAPPGFIGGNGLFRELDDALIDQLRSPLAAAPSTRTSPIRNASKTCPRCTTVRRSLGCVRSSGRGIRRTSSDAITTSTHDAEQAGDPVVSGPFSLRRERQCVSSASISVRSPDHSVWKVPSLSMRLYVCAPKKSRCPCTSAAGRRSARMPS